MLRSRGRIPIGLPRARPRQQRGGLRRLHLIADLLEYPQRLSQRRPRLVQVTGLRVHLSQVLDVIASPKSAPDARCLRRAS